MLYEVKDEHKGIVEDLLEVLSVADGEITASAILLLQEDGTFYSSIENHSFAELLVIKGYLDLAIQERYKQTNGSPIICSDCDEEDEDES